MTMNEPGHIRRATESDWLLVRALRLRGLAEDPLSFGSRLQEEDANPEERWRSWIAANAFFVASLGGRDVGLVRTQRLNPDTFGIYSLWVAAEARRNGVATGLLAAAEAFAAESGAKAMELSVVDAAEAAQTLYEKAGYRRIGSEPARQPGLVKLLLRKELSASR